MSPLLREGACAVGVTMGTRTALTVCAAVSVAREHAARWPVGREETAEEPGLNPRSTGYQTAF